MPKKSRRAKAKHRARVASVAQVAQVAQEERSQQLVPVPVELRSPTRVSPKAQDLTSRYQYVMPEIKRIGIIAGAIIVVLIILSFVLG
jgi:tRNA U54 and U55 pseudouridine synthase Pus10